MGIFSDKTVLTGGVSITPLVQHKPNLARDAILRATFNDWDKTASIVDAYISGYSVDPEKMYKYAEDPNGFVNGLPSGEQIIRLPKLELFKEVAASHFGLLVSDITHLRTLEFGLPDAVHVAWEYCHIHFGRNDNGVQHANLEQSNGDLCKVVDAVFVEEAGVWKIQINFQNLSALRDPNFPEFFSNVYDLGGSLSIVSPTSDCYYISFNTLTKQTVSNRYYHTYQASLNLHPELNPDDSVNQGVPFYPIMPIRINGQFITEQANNQLWTTGTKLLENINVDIQTMQDALADNPDIDQVDDSFITLGVPIGRSFELDQDMLAYLFEYFEYLKTTETVSSTEFAQSVSAGSPKFNRYRVTDREFDTEVVWNYIDTQIDPGRPGKPVYEIYYYTHPGDYDPTKDDFYSLDYITIIRRSEESVKTLIVRGLFNVAYVIQKKPTITTLRNAVSTRPEDVDLYSEGLFIPLDRNILNRFNNKRKTSVAMQSTILVNYAIQKTKIDWYKRKAFWNFVRIVVFIVSIVTYSPQLSVIVEGVVSEIVTMIIESIIIDLLIEQAVGYVLSLLADTFGGEFALILAAIAAVYGASSAITSITIDVALPLATELMNLSGLMVNKINEHTRSEVKKLQDEQNEFLLDAMEAERNLKEASSTLIDGYFDPLWYMQKSGIVTGETPDMFYNRSLLVNNDFASLDTISNYHSNQLSLPSTNDIIIT